MENQSSERKLANDCGNDLSNITATQWLTCTIFTVVKVFILIATSWTDNLSPPQSYLLTPTLEYRHAGNISPNCLDLFKFITAHYQLQKMLTPDAWSVL